MSSVNKICTCIYVSSCSNQQQWFTLKYIACACFINQLWLSKLSLPLRCNTSTYSYLLQKQKMHCLWEVYITDHKNKDNNKELFFCFFFLQCSLYIQQNVEVDNDCYPNPVMLTLSLFMFLAQTKRRQSAFWCSQWQQNDFCCFPVVQFILLLFFTLFLPIHLL